jgi:hypothetical protein
LITNKQINVSPPPINFSGVIKEPKMKDGYNHVRGEEDQSPLYFDQQKWLKMLV